jgi:hypothetical protein
LPLFSRIRQFIMGILVEEHARQTGVMTLPNLLRKKNGMGAKLGHVEEMEVLAQPEASKGHSYECRPPTRRLLPSAAIVVQRGFGACTTVQVRV